MYDNSLEEYMRKKNKLLALNRETLLQLSGRVSGGTATATCAALSCLHCSGVVGLCSLGFCTPQGCITTDFCTNQATCTQHCTVGCTPGCNG